jgi:16S rRNA (guanine966-N2)-methyltransferase
MRIIAGLYKGQTLYSPSSIKTRPTSDKVRQSIFNILSSHFLKEGKSFEALKVLDVFAGTGALGFEALSRGAPQVTFIESSPTALDVIRKNIEKLGVESQTTLVKGSAFFPRVAPYPFDLVFMDPPYEQESIQKSFAALHKKRWFSEGALFVVEYSRFEEDPYLDNKTIFDVRQYGNTKVCFLEAKRNQDNNKDKIEKR